MCAVYTADTPPPLPPRSATSNNSILWSDSSWLPTFDLDSQLATQTSEQVSCRNEFQSILIQCHFSFRWGNGAHLVVHFPVDAWLCSSHWHLGFLDPSAAHLLIPAWELPYIDWFRTRTDNFATKVKRFPNCLSSADGGLSRVLVSDNWTKSRGTCGKFTEKRNIWLSINFLKAQIFT